MSDIGGAGNDAFDAMFSKLEYGGVPLLIGVFLLALFAPLKLRSWLSYVLLVLGVALGIGVPLYWNIEYPATNGLEGAGRLIFGAPFSVLDAVLASIAVVLLRPRGQRLIAIGPAAGAVLVWLPMLLQ